MITHDEMREILNHPDILKTTKRMSDSGYIDVMYHAISYLRTSSNGIVNASTLLMSQQLIFELRSTSIPNIGISTLEYILGNDPHLREVLEYRLDDVPEVIIAYARDLQTPEFAGMQIRYPRSIHVVYLE